jgi:hypothetical protein
MTITFTPTPAEENLRKNLSSIVQQIIATNVEDLVQTTRLGREAGFEELRSLFQKSIMLFQALSTANLDFLSEAKLQRLANVANEMNNEFAQVRGFQLNQLQNRQSRMQSVRQKFDECYDVIAPIVGASQQVSLEAYTERARQTVQALEEAHAIFNTKTQAMQKEVEDTLVKAKEVTAKAGIAEHAAHFRQESEEHKRAGWIWLCVTVVLALATARLAWINYGKTLAVFEQWLRPSLQNSTPVPTAVVVQLTVAKIIGFSILFSAVLWAGRIYRAHQHNYVVNKHRQNALSTFEAFAKAASGDPETKNAVLLQATQCIFNPQATGYLGQEKDSEGHSSVLEIFRTMPSAKP